ncbi:MAG TPA: bifunctional DNA-formamidopyrimidine glycosylase/DNA-(apurinic or apyrimidinic site) lyase [Gaiellaceae bacterium]|nr:bifunctional DNA-formamidopyrimidine glycosylase/DNA-(apurinic or apyrimidinic site) lyase [Gaiellaceae bacterium]
MPELPEVETIRVGLEPHLVGRTFDEVEIDDPRLTRPFDPREVAAQLVGERVQSLDRRGKYLVVRFESGRVLLIHLRMTGSLLLLRDGTAADDPYCRAVVKLDNGSDVAYRDVRRFGTWLLLQPGELEPYLAERIGAEPLGRSLSARSLADRIARRRAPLKALVLDQRLFAGVGNIYADEALWWARLHPLRPGNELTADELGSLVKAIRRALRLGIARQGATLRDYRAADGGRGSMQTEFRVYGREGEPCTRCGHGIEKTRVAGRGTWYCPGCQV